MPISNAQVALRGLPNYPEQWALDDELTYDVPEPIQGRHGPPDFVIVKKGFRTDLASIPRLFWNVLPPFGRYTAAAVVHDYLYQAHENSRAQADAVFYAAMRELDVPAWKAQTMWSAVRLFGRRSWREGPGKGGIVPATPLEAPA